MDKQILIVEQDLETLALIEDYISSSKGFEETRFHHATELMDAVGYIVGYGIDLVIVDPRLIGEYGFALIKTIKDYSPGTRVIAWNLCVQNPCDGHCTRQCERAGADHSLDKESRFAEIPFIAKSCLAGFN